MSCCPTTKTAAESKYTPKNIPVYEAGCYKSKTAVIYVPDIFGFTKQAKAVADILAESTGYRVVAFDPFNGEPWPKSKFPPGPGDDLMGWINSFNFETVIKPMVEQLVEKLKYQGVETFYGIGFCWGSKMIYDCQIAGLVTKIACPHPSFFNDELKTIAGPICFMPSKDEAPLLGFKETLMKSEFGAQSYFERFDTQNHGWMGARFDEKDEENVKELERGIELITKFYKQ